MLNLFQSEAPGWHLHCGTAIAGPGSHSCRTPSCTQERTNPLDGYCPTCSKKRGSNSLKACGFQPIKLTSDAMVPVMATPTTGTSA